MTSSHAASDRDMMLELQMLREQVTSIFMSVCLCLCVYVCLCVREREKERSVSVCV